MSIPDDLGFKLIDMLWGSLMAVLGMLWKTQGDKIAAVELTLNRRMDAEFADTQGTLNAQQGHIEKLFDELKDDRNRSTERHIELMRAIHDGLNGKKDKE